MSIPTQTQVTEEVVYPESDGQPMADNTLQFEWITTIKGGLDALFRDDPNVFVAGDLLWYPVEGNNTIRIAPDAMVAIGRPKGDRGSYQQWREGGIAPQVVFEVLSPGNRAGEMVRKFRFYDRYGVEEYYIYDPDNKELTGWCRSGSILEEVLIKAGWISPRLGVRFDMSTGSLRLYGPDGQSFVSYVELARERDARKKERDAMETERNAMEKERDAERQRADRLAAQLRAMGVDPEH
jgi:Uma2 family endonuclease